MLTTCLLYLALPVMIGSMKLDLYYESRCGFSVNFIKDQLLPTWNMFSYYIELNLIPYGFTEWYEYNTGGYNFTCHHGERECLGNKLHACAIRTACGRATSKGCHPKDLTKAVNYIACLVSLKKGQEPAFQECANRHGLDANYIDGCAHGRLGDRLLVIHGKTTDTLLSRVNDIGLPYIILNDVRNDAEAEEAQFQLQNVFCRYNPQFCGGSDEEISL